MAKKALDHFVDDDSKLCLKYAEEAIVELCEDHRITEDEFEDIVNGMKEFLNRLLLCYLLPVRMELLLLYVLPIGIMRCRHDYLIER